LLSLSSVILLGCNYQAVYYKFQHSSSLCRCLPYYQTFTMTKAYLQFLIYSLFILTTCNCQEKKTSYNPKAIEFNNKAMEFIKTEKFDSSLIYLDKAIKIDSTYYIAYGNKCIVYCTLKDFKNALVVTEKEIKAKPDLAEGWTFAGMLNDKLGDTLNALKYYKKSIEIFDERISNPDKQTYLKANKLNRAIALILIGQNDKGRDELRKLKQIYPSDEFIDDFLKLNKQEYLKQIFNDE
ncbi:MAG: hypothetical protein ABI168_09690, partial [Ginsengibacter sp.]